MSANILERAQEFRMEPPRPLARDLPPADPFPMDALGDVLGAAAHAIHDRTQAPKAICGNSVLAAATLAAQGHADVELPTGHARPLSEFFATVAASGERKSAADNEALKPIRKREAKLREAYDFDWESLQNDKIAWDKARDAAVKRGKGDRSRIKKALDALGPPPDAPLHPMLTCPEPTYEGMVKLLASGWPSLGIFAAEGGQFVGGHGMTQEAKLRTAAGLSNAWDGEPIRRVRSGDGATNLPGRRLAMHLMLQPDVAAILLGDSLLIDQGFASRQLVTAPESTAGTRLWREPKAESELALSRYDDRVLSILECPLPVSDGRRNELKPRALPLSSEARAAWIGFADHIERAIAPNGALESVRGLANKLPEHAARLAAVLALTENINAAAVELRHLEAGIALGQHYAAEALRLFGASRVSADIRLAQRLLAWLHVSWQEPLVSLPDIYQRGLNAIGDKATASRIVDILADHGWLNQIDGGGIVAGKKRRDVWQIVRAG